MENNPDILKEDVLQRGGFKASSNYDHVHLLQWAHMANLQTLIEITGRKREWQAFIEDGDAGREAKFEVRTTWHDLGDCMDLLTTTIYYHPLKPSDDGSVFFITEKILAVPLAGAHTVESPLKSFRTVEQIKDYLQDNRSPYKLYLVLEHIMEQLDQSDEGRRQAHSYMKGEN